MTQQNKTPRRELRNKCLAVLDLILKKGGFGKIFSLKIQSHSKSFHGFEDEFQKIQWTEKPKAKNLIWTGPG